MKEAGKILGVIGAATFAVFIVLYKLNAVRAENAARDLGTYAGIEAGQWIATSEWQLGVALVGLLIAVIGVAVARAK